MTIDAIKNGVVIDHIPTGKALEIYRHLHMEKLDCSVALYGHTHQADVTELGGVLLVNPGSLRFDVGQGGSYAYLVVCGEKVTAVIVGESPSYKS